MTKEIIDTFLDNNNAIKNSIKNISKNYTLNDFVLFSDVARDHFMRRNGADMAPVYGCICGVRDRSLRVDVDSVESRLTIEYLQLISELLEAHDEIDIVYYIVAYHYLTLCEEVAFEYTIANYAIFPFCGRDLSPWAKRRLKEYHKIQDGDFHRLMECIGEENLMYFNHIFNELRHHHHATKHFSLIDYLTNGDVLATKYEFYTAFRNALDLFCFRYKAVYTEERLSQYMFAEAQEKVVSNLKAWE